MTLTDRLPDALEPDGCWAPMTHSNLLDNSIQELPPIRVLNHMQSIPEPNYAFVSLGTFTGEHYAVCSFEDPKKPGIVAFDYDTGAIRWQSAVEDLPPVDKLRWTAGLLLAKVYQGGRDPQRMVFAVNPSEAIAYDRDGRHIWKRRIRELVPEDRNGCGFPRCVRPTPDNEILFTTSYGWIIKLNPLTGALVDAYRMQATIAYNGQIHSGYFQVAQSPVMVGRTLYLTANFRAPTLQNPEESPVYLVRVVLSGGTGRSGQTAIRPLTHAGPREESPDYILLGVLGKFRFGGSPSGMLGSDGTPIIVGNAHRFVDNHYRPTISAVADRDGVLQRRWETRLVQSDQSGDPQILAAPALAFGIHMAPSRNGLQVIRDVHRQQGTIQPSQLVPSLDLLTPDIRSHAQSAIMTSPLAVVCDRDNDELVVYSCVRVTTPHSSSDYGFMAAYALPLSHPGQVHPLWSVPLALTADGEPAPNRGSYGQPALFRYAGNKDLATGLITNTVSNGTVIFR